MACSLVNLGSCLPEVFFQFLLDILNAPVQPFLQLTLNLLSEPINLSIFISLWVIVVYVLSMLYALLIVAAGFNFMIAGYDSEKRENAKQWLRNIVIMIILIQASFFIYQLTIDLSASLTSATLSLIDEDFFLIGSEDIIDLGLALLLGFLYILVLILTVLLLAIRYAVVAIGVAFFPLAIFFYFFNPLKQYGSLILNFLGISIFLTFIDALLLAGFSRLMDVSVFSSMKIVLLISSFLFIDLIMFFLLCFAVIKSAFSIYSDVRRLGARL